MRAPLNCLLLSLALCFPASSLAEDEEDGFFSKIGDAISGHVQDAKSRFAEGTSIEGQVIRTAQLRRDLPGSDSVHYGTGTVTLEEKDERYYVQFADDTRIGLAPDLNIYVSFRGDVIDEASFAELEPLHLGEMSKPNGASYYQLPEGKTPAEVKSVVVWCRRFNEFMSSAAF